ncbi:MAG TPA: zf-HC2 domain-containing protein [Acidimicrobiales bacterium]|nr:zf-HC2 domain-containing protein [Acidimicrobiales bacterium]
MRPASTVIGCHVAREAISALVDGEEPLVPRSVTSGHLARCQACREFQAGVATLRRQMSVRALAPSPDRASEVLTLLGFGGQAPTANETRARPWAHRRHIAWIRASQWAVGAVPLGVAVPALALGVFAHPHIVPPHVLSPCTMGLAHHFRR